MKIWTTTTPGAYTATNKKEIRARFSNKITTNKEKGH
jgi:hypothetical protein